MFVKGDLVECIDNHSCDLLAVPKEGYVYEVVEVFADNVRVLIDGQTYGYFPWRFKKASLSSKKELI